MSEFDYTYKTGTSKQKRKYDKYIDDYIIKKNNILNIRELLENKKLKMAKSCIDNYLEKYGEDGYILHELAKYYNCTDDLENAKKYYELVIMNNYKNKYYSMYELAKLYKREDNIDKAIEILTEIIKSDHPETCHAELELAKEYYILGKLNKTLPILINLIETDQPNKLLAFDLLVEYAIFFRNPGLIRKYFEYLKNEFDKDYQELYVGIIEITAGYAYDGKARLEKIEPKNDDIKAKKLHHLAVVYHDFDEYDKAIEYLEELVKIEPSNTNYSSLIDMYIKIKDFDTAEYYIETAKNNKNCEIDDIYLRTGNLYFMKQEYEKAIEYYNKIVKKYRLVYRDSIYKKICSFIKLKRFEEIMPLYKELKELDINKRFDYLYTSSLVEILCSKNLNLPYLEPKLYAETLIVDYDKEKVLEHIGLHKMENNSKRIHSVFNENVDIEELYNYALENLNEETFAFNNLMDNYIIDYPNVGTIDGRIVNKVEVITLPNTKEIITIFPCRKKYKEIVKEKQKVKQMSRIDKFNKKYNL